MEKLRVENSSFPSKVACTPFFYIFIFKNITSQTRQKRMQEAKSLDVLKILRDMYTNQNALHQSAVSATTDDVKAVHLEIDRLAHLLDDQKNKLAALQAAERKSDYKL